MIDDEISVTEQVEDIYPSRTSPQATVTPRKDPVVYANDFANAPIKAELVEQYQQQGFLILEGVFSETEVCEFQQELGRLCQHESIKTKAEAFTEKDSADVRSIFRVHELSPVFERLSRDPRTLALARYLLADDVYIHQSRLNYKPGFRGKEFYWHSDFETWHVEDGMPRMRALSIRSFTAGGWWI